MSNPTNKLFNELKKIIPQIPDDVVNLKLSLDVGDIPTLEVTTYVFESQLLTPETETKTFNITEIE